MTDLRYIELKTGYHGNGPAWIGRVTLSRTKTTVYFNGRAFKRIKGGGASSNYIDSESKEAFWISGIKKNGEDRHWTGSGRVQIEAAALSEYLAIRNLEKLDSSRYEVTDAIVQTDIAKFKKIENHSAWKAWLNGEQQ